MGRILLIAAAIALAIYAIADCARTPNDQMPAHLPKPIWLLIILLTTPLGPIGWIIISRVMRAENNGGRLDASIWSSDESSIQGIQFGHQHNRPPRDLGPDDDPEFLWRLEKELRAERQARKNAEQEPDLPREQQPQENNGEGPGEGEPDHDPSADRKSQDANERGNDDDSNEDSAG
ncbi:PLDc N-terminal domain-containing protein [Gleimia hominis]|uniref:PLDc N-terminal domain-containing protein n=1 Tax=Gleimia hominis TaxID=595468 RepID=A0ABU3IA29_9ACTO|nr:PLDc N-terminal domain-containing protein [Gleimia hominis]MDT3767073.1 PLDc N-terminal domain-containing protein [Gleimia hominis]